MRQDRLQRSAGQPSTSIQQWYSKQVLAMKATHVIAMPFSRVCCARYIAGSFLLQSGCVFLWRNTFWLPLGSPEN